MADAFECPYCGRFSPLDSVTEYQNVEFNGAGKRALTRAWVRQQVCLNPNCSMETLDVGFSGQYGIASNVRRRVDPVEGTRHLPSVVPPAIAADFAEASSIAALSPKASATLARRVIQGMIHDFWEIEARTLFDEIDALKDKVAPDLWNGIDALRRVGNVGAHMKKPTTEIVEVEPEEAQLLLDLVELLAKEWYVRRAERVELLRAVGEVATKVDPRNASTEQSKGTAE
jgi:hypothetical protein